MGYDSFSAAGSCSAEKAIVPPEVSVSQCLFAGNLATDHGGAIGLQSGSLQLSVSCQRSACLSRAVYPRDGAATLSCVLPSCMAARSAFAKYGLTLQHLSLQLACMQGSSLTGNEANAGSAGAMSLDGLLSAASLTRACCSSQAAGIC